MLCSLQAASGIQVEKTGNPVGIRAARGWVELSFNATGASVDVGVGEHIPAAPRSKGQHSAVPHNVELLRVLFGNQLQHSLCQCSGQNNK